MNATSLNYYLNISINSALQAGEAIRKIYFSDQMMVEYKRDLSPITLADQHAHECIVKELTKTGLPVLSEEGAEIDFEERKNWKQFWLVDPLDGTKEFVRRNDDFTVNVSLVDGQEPVIGVVYSPINGLLYFGAKGIGAFKRDTCFDKTIDEKKFNLFLAESLSLPIDWQRKRFTVAVSKSHLNDKTLDFVNKLVAKFGDVETISIGSSLKMCLVSEGRADIYPRLSKTMEWDTAAGHAIAVAAGFSVTLPDGESSLRYNKPDLSNPYFIVKHSTLQL